MQKVIFGFIMLLLSVVNAIGQERKASLATVEKVGGVPLFLFSQPVEKYEVVGKAVSGGKVFGLVIDETLNVSDKAQKMVEKALAREKEGKVPAFDALLVDIDKMKSKVIKFKNGASLKAHVLKENGVPVYFYAKPDDDYEVVARLPADYSLYAARNLLVDKIVSSVNRVLKKEKSGEVGHFDAVMFNPDDLSTTLIKFK